jgi:hypothetical protein
MSQRTLAGKLLSPAGFGLVLIFCLLPFLTVSCGTQTETIDSTFTGVDLVIGGPPDITGPGVDAGAEQELRDLFADRMDLEPLALLAALLLFAGMGVSLVRDRRLGHGLAIALALGAAALLTGAVLRAGPRVDDALTELNEGNDLPEALSWDVHLQYGFWLAMAALVGLAAGHAVALVRTRGQPAPVEDDLEPEPVEG